MKPSFTSLWTPSTVSQILHEYQSSDDEHYLCFASPSFVSIWKSHQRDLQRLALAFDPKDTDLQFRINDYLFSGECLFYLNDTRAQRLAFLQHELTRLTSSPCPAPTPPLPHLATSADPAPSTSSAPSLPMTPTTPTSPTAPDAPPATSQPTGLTNPSTARPISAVHIDPDFLSDEVYSALSSQLTIPSGETLYSTISLLTPNEAFDHYLTYHGIINYTHQITSALSSIQSAATQP